MLDINTSFTLRRLELGTPILNKLKNNELGATAELAAIAMADEQTLKLVAAGNQEALKVFIDKALDMDCEEVAALLSNFTVRLHRYTLVQSGLKPEEVNQIQGKTQKNLREALGLELQEN